MAEEGQRRLAAIMFTDMVRYSALTQRDEALALELLEKHFQLLRPVIANHQGREIKTTGDSMMVEFASSLQAVRCAIAMQKVMSDHNASASQERAIWVRIGIHLGDVEHREGDVFGDGVNITARIEPLAEPGGICVTRAVCEQVEGKLKEELICLGKQTLKNIARPVEIYKVVLQPQSAELSAQGPDPTRLAVLPLANLSPDPEDEYFADGMTEELIDALAKVEGLKVISRTSSFYFRGKNVPMRQIGEELGVRHVLEGSVRKAGSRVRVTAQLVDVETDQHLWSEKYDRDLEDIFAVQDEIARAIVDELRGQLAGGRDQTLVEPATRSEAAYDAYLRGRFFLAKRTREGLKKAIEFFGQAIEQDPEFAQAYVERGLSRYLLAEYGHAFPQDVLPPARADMVRALELNSSLPMAQAANTLLTLVQDWDWARAEGSARRAIELNPDDPLPHYFYAFNVLGPQARFDEALAEMRRALELDPLSLVLNRNLGVFLWCARRHEEAERQLLKTLEMDERFALAHHLLGQVYLTTERPDDALAAFQREVEMGTWVQGGIVVALSRLGREDEAARALEELTKGGSSAPQGPWVLAMTHAQLDHPDRCFAWLERAFEQGEPHLRELKAFPVFDNVRSDPRFHGLLRRINLEP